MLYGLRMTDTNETMYITCEEVDRPMYQMSHWSDTKYSR